MPGVELICVWGMNSLVFDICEILPGGVVVAALDLTVTFANGGVNGLAGVAVEVEREGVFRLAGRAGVSGGLTLVGL